MGYGINCNVRDEWGTRLTTLLALQRYGKPTRHTGSDRACCTPPPQ